MSLEMNLQLAEKAIQYVRTHVRFSSNKVADRLAFAGGVEKVIRDGKGNDPALRNVHDVIRRGQEFSRRYADEVIRRGIGNCGEMALIAHIWLHDQGARPIDYMQFGSRPPLTDHAWVTIGRVPESDLAKLNTWGAEAVWCDPWQGDGMAFSINDLIKGKVRNLNWQFDLHRVDLIEQGMPTTIIRFE